MTMTDPHRQLLDRYVAAIVAGDVDTIESLQHPDVRWWVLGVGDLDRDQFMAGCRAALFAATSRSIRITGVTVEGERLAYEAEGEMAFPDRVYRNVYHNLWVIRDGLIVEGREYMDPRTDETGGAD